MKWYKILQNENNYYTIAKTLLLIFIVTLSSCERDLDLKEQKTEIKESQFEKLNGFFNAEGKIITPMQLPDPFKNKLFAVIDIKVADKQSQQAILETYFESKVSVIKIEEGVITYALPIKHNAKIKNKFKKTLLSKSTTKNICDDSLYEVFALNIDSQTGAAGDLNVVSFSSSYASDSSGGHTGGGTGVYLPTLIYTTILNTSTGNSSTFSTPRSNS